MCRLILDAMPLQQRLTTTVQQPKIEIPAVPVVELKSQPLSPTKLKVTRQSNQQQPQQYAGPKKQETTPVAQQSMQQVEEEVCLRWNSHHSNMQTSFPDLLQKEQYVDVTLASEGKMLKCHRVSDFYLKMFYQSTFLHLRPYQTFQKSLKIYIFLILKRFFAS